ncbi:MAG: type III pantothenate kinase [Nannocystaceae bacterium]
MLLAVDIGNTHTCVGLFEGDELRCELRLTTHRDWTRDEVAVTLVQALELRGLSLAVVDEAVLACVVPPALKPFSEAIQRYAEVTPLVVGPGVKTGMPIRYEPATDVGADRIVSAVAAHAAYGDPGAGRGVVVVDFGTATTFDVVSPTPEYLGGAIAPGIGISADALFTRAARLPRVALKMPEQVVGKNTIASLQSGLMYGYVSLVEGMVQRLREDIAWPVTVVGTGGLATTIAAVTSSIDIVNERLMLDGLRLIFERNSLHARRG